jgi:hypothetical protein
MSDLHNKKLGMPTGGGDRLFHVRPTFPPPSRSFRCVDKQN